MNVTRASIVHTAETFGLTPALRVYRRLYAWRVSLKSNADIFRDQYFSNAWGDPESASGTGSNLRATQAIRAALPPLLAEFNVRTLLDAPCGDFNWLRWVELGDIQYIGIDVVNEIIAANARYKTSSRSFVTADLINDRLPRTDLILCRDALVHFPYREARRAVAQFKASGATYLLSTSFPGRQNRDIPLMGHWRPLDLQASPFNFPTPVRLISEQCDEPSFTDKHLGLWLIRDLP